MPTELFDIIEANKRIEEILRRAVSKVTDSIKVDWLKLEWANERGVSFRWRLAKIDSGHTQVTEGALPRQVVAAIANVRCDRSTAAALRTLTEVLPQMDEVASVLGDRLRSPISEWKAPRKRGS